MLSPVFQMTVHPRLTQRHSQTIPTMQSPPRTIMVFLIISQGYILRLIFPVYYRVYTYDGAIPSNSAAYLNDDFLGRISVGQISLPRTIKSLKRCIVAVEGIISHLDRITLYTSATIEKTIDDKSPITPDSGPGSTPDEPMTLVFEGRKNRCHRSEPESTLVRLPPSKLKSPLKLRYCTNFA